MLSDKYPCVWVSVFFSAFLCHSVMAKLATSSIKGWRPGLIANLRYYIGPRIYCSCKFFTGPTNFSLAWREKTLHKIHWQHLFLFILSSFISITFGDIPEGKFVNKNIPKCLLALSDQFRSFFYWPKDVFVNFYWPWDSHSLFRASSPIQICNFKN